MARRVPSWALQKGFLVEFAVLVESLNAHSVFGFAGIKACRSCFTIAGTS